MTTKFQDEFKRLRQSRSWTQAEMAKALGISRSAVGMYEQGKREPDFEALEKIADAFNVSMSSLIERPPDVGVLDQNEQILIRAYRSAGADLKARLMRYAMMIMDMEKLEYETTKKEPSDDQI